jgi:hypothetical protein
MIHPQGVLSRTPRAVHEVNEMPAAGALVLLGAIIRTALAVPIVVALVFVFWKIGKLADAYAKKLKAT